MVEIKRKNKKVGITEKNTWKRIFLTDISGVFNNCNKHQFSYKYSTEGELKKRQNWFYKNMARSINDRKISVLSSLWNIGLTFLCIFVCIGYIVYKKQLRLMMIHVPIIMLYLTTIALPMWCEYRDVYIFTTLPITTIGTIYCTNKIDREKWKDYGE